MTDHTGGGATPPPPAQIDQLQALIRKIPLFSGLTPDDAARILAGSHMRTLEGGTRLCTQGDDAGSLFILLKGKLAVSIKNSSTIATIHPVSSIGELGVFTEQPRNATVDAMEPSTVLEFRKADLDALIERVPALGVRIMQNVVRILSARIAEDNIKLREYQNYVISQFDNEPPREPAP